MNAEYRQALSDLERLRINHREVSPEFWDDIDLELRAAEKRLMEIIKGVKRNGSNNIQRQC